MTITHRVSRRTVGGWLREKRTRLQLSQAEVAREAGITQGALSNYEMGKREVTVGTLLRLSSALDADLGELLGASETILHDGSRLARAAALLRERDLLLDRLVPPEPGAPLIGRGTYVPRTNELTWSDDYYRILGWEPGEVEPSAELFYQRIHPDDRPRLGDYFERLLAGTSHVRGFQVRVVVPEQEVRTIRTQSQAEYDAAGTPVVLRGMLTYYPTA